MYKQYAEDVYWLNAPRYQAQDQFIVPVSEDIYGIVIKLRDGTNLILEDFDE